MKYEAPQLTALTPAIDAIQSTSKFNTSGPDGIPQNEVTLAYEDWE